MSVSNDLSALPSDLLRWGIGPFFSRGDLVSLLRTSSKVKKWVQKIIDQLARNDQQRLNIMPFRPHWDLENCTRHLQNISLNEALEIRNNLRARPFTYFRELDVLFERSFLDARDDSRRIANLVFAEPNRGRRIALAYSIPNEYIRSEVLESLASGLPIGQALEIVKRIPNEFLRNQALEKLATRDDVAIEQALKIVDDDISDDYFKSQVLCKLARRDDLLMGPALNSALGISDENFKSQAISSLLKGGF